MTISDPSSITKPALAQSLRLAANFFNKHYPKQENEPEDVTLVRRSLNRSMDVLEREGMPRTAYILTSEVPKTGRILYWNNILGWTDNITHAQQFSDTNHPEPLGHKVAWQTLRIENNCISIDNTPSPHRP